MGWVVLYLLAGCMVVGVYLRIDKEAAEALTDMSDASTILAVILIFSLVLVWMLFLPAVLIKLLVMWIAGIRKGGHSDGDD